MENVLLGFSLKTSRG